MLRPYQTAALVDDAACRLRGARVVCCVAPTGAGKTMIAREWVMQQNGVGVWVAHRGELLDNAAAGFPYLWPDRLKFQMIQARELPVADWYVLDECHHLYGTPLWSKRVEACRGKPTL